MTFRDRSSIGKQSAPKMLCLQSQRCEKVFESTGRGTAEATPFVQTDYSIQSTEWSTFFMHS
jgi:hypothetical protein